MKGKLLQAKQYTSPLLQPFCHQSAAVFRYEKFHKFQIIALTLHFNIYLD